MRKGCDVSEQDDPTRVMLYPSALKGFFSWKLIRSHKPAIVPMKKHNVKMIHFIDLSIARRCTICADAIIL